jgi:hypothetical protein
MAGSLSVGGVNLQPSSEQVALSTNYITNFNFLDQYLPDTYEKEFERYGNRSVSGFMRQVGAELPSTSDLIKWAEQGRLHTKYIDCTTTVLTTADTATFTINDTLDPGTGSIAVRVGQTIHLSVRTLAGSTATTNKAIVTAVNTGAGTIDVAFYEADGMTNDNVGNIYEMFIYGSEFNKGTNGMVGSLEADDLILDNKPIIIKDNYEVSGSDMAQIGWVEVTTENGATGYLWYLKSEHETRLRFDDYLETAMIEAVPAEAASGALVTAGVDGSDGVFYSVNDRGNVWSGGYPTTLSDWDTIVARLDKQGAIEENALFVNRAFGFAIDDMLADQSTTTGASFGLFDNDKDMALNLGFSGFRRGYDFYKTDWKYLNDESMRGGLSAGIVSGLLVPAGTTSVYDQVMGKNAKRPFLHVRYRASKAEDRRYKTWITGSAGGAATSDLDAMEVNFLSERCVCTLGANNFVLFEG